MEDTEMHIAKRKMPISKDYIPYDFKYMTLWKRQSCRDSKKLSGCQGLGGRDKKVECRKSLMQWNYPVRYCDGEFMSLYIGQTPLQTQHRVNPK